MARNIYGASGAAQVVSLTGTPTLAAATVKTARTGGTTVTDVLNMAGANIAGIVTPDSRGQIIFQGPDNATATYWLDFGDGGPRWAVNPVDFTSLVSGAMLAREAAQNLAPGSVTAKAALPYVDNTAFENLALALDAMVIRRFASSGARDTAFPAPADGDRCYRTDLHAHQTYRALSTGRWVTDTALIDEFTLGVDTASIGFLNIPQEWRHLVIKYHARAVGSNASYTNTQPVGIRCNNDTGATYNVLGFIRNIRVNTGTPTYETSNAGAGGSTTTTTAAVYGRTDGGLSNIVFGGQTVAWAGVCTGSSFSTLFGGGEIRIDNYTSSASRKPIQGNSGYADNGGYPSGSSGSCTSQLQGGWANSAAITRLDVLPVAATAFAAGSRFSLYGLS